MAGRSAIAVLCASALVLARSSPVAEANACGNGNVCPVATKCATHSPGAGQRYACIPDASYNLCEDVRFSAPAGSDCSNGSVQRVENVDASFSGLQDGISFCALLQPKTLSACDCEETDGGRGGVLSCSVSVDGDKLGLELAVKPCALPEAYIDLAATESLHNLSFSLAGIKAGQEESFPLPGVSIAIPKVGNAGLDVVVELGGNLDNLTIEAGFDACLGVGGKEVCGEKLAPELLPLWLLKGTFHFASICSNETTALPALPVVV